VATDTPTAAALAVAVPRVGPADVLSTVVRPVRALQEGEVLIRVAASPVHPTDTAMRSGEHADLYGELPDPCTPGMDLAGTIAAIGPGVDRFAVGDEVMAVVHPLRPEGGAQAELVVAPAVSVATVPAGASLLEAASLPMNGLTALHAIDVLALPPGAVLAVSGGAGTLASLAIPLAKAAGLTVVADAAPADEALVRGFGADVVVPRSDDLAATLRERYPDGVDAVLDTAVIGPPVLAAVRDGGVLATVRLFRGESERGIDVRPVWVSERMADTAALEHLRDLVVDGTLTLPPVVATYPPARAGEAHTRMEAGGVRGRLLIVF
jgi:NADPH:quinone reductase-like Zn-dependent oxidoreductase